MIISLNSNCYDVMFVRNLFLLYFEILLWTSKLAVRYINSPLTYFSFWLWRRLLCVNEAHWTISVYLFTINSTFHARNIFLSLIKHSCSLSERIYRIHMFTILNAGNDIFVWGTASESVTWNVSLATTTSTESSLISSCDKQPENIYCSFWMEFQKSVGKYEQLFV